MARCGEGIPRDVEPTVACQELVGIRTGAKEVDQKLELARVLGSNVRSLAREVLRVLDTTHQSVHSRVAETGVNDNGTVDSLAGGFQQQMAAVGHVGHVLRRRNVGRVLLQVAELCQRKMRR